MSAQTLRAQVGTLAGAAILVVLVWQLGTGAFLDGLRRIDGPTLLAALGLGLLTTVFSAWRWCVVARGLSIRMPLGRAVADYYRALFLNAALPGGVLGDVHRAVRHGQNAGDVGRGVRAVVLERTAGQVVLIAVGATVLLALPSPALEQPRHLVASPGAALALAVLCALVVAVVVRRRTRLRGKPGTSRWHGAVRAALAEARLGLLARGSWPGVVISSVVVLAGHLGTFLLAARAAGATAPLAELAPLMVLALLAMALPLNVGGWGPREGVTAWAFGAAGLGAAQGLTVAVVYGVLTFAASLPGVGVLAGQWLARLRRPQLQLEERVLAEEGASHRRAERVAHHRLTGEAEPRDAVAEQHRRHGDVEAVQCLLMQEARHGDAAALDQHPAQATPRERLHQAARGERITVRQDQYVNAVTDTVRSSLVVLAGRAHHPQGRG
ncbi:flippase-like domain-containing protein [Streptomyces sp. ISL-1]|nr:flippase-like domain-containing protein [Streptomyces sp. ISL-1]